MDDEAEARHMALCDAGWRARRYRVPEAVHHCYYCDGFRDGQAAEHKRQEAVIAAARAYRAAYDADTDEEEKTTRRALDEALAALDGSEHARAGRLAGDLAEAMEGWEGDADSERALRVRCLRLEEALREMLRWFGKWPEMLPIDERYADATAAIEQARAVLAADVG